MGKFPRECVLCGYRGKFLGHGYPYVCDILCPKCGSLEHHRLLALANREYDFFYAKDIFHFAPHAGIRDLILAHRPRSYVTAGLFAPDVTPNDDSACLAIEDSAYDVAICQDVLEHVNDESAISELYRVLRPGGVLLATFPIVEGWDETFEDTARSTPQERLLYFGQRDHARYFGRDARQRLAAPGFIVEEYTAIEPAVSRYGLARGEKVFICSRPSVRRSNCVEHGAMAGMNRTAGSPAPLHPFPS